MTRQKTTTQSLRRLKAAGLSPEKVRELGGKCSKGGNCTFTEADPGFEEICKLFGVVFPPSDLTSGDPNERELIRLLTGDAPVDDPTLLGERIHALAKLIKADRLMQLKEMITGVPCKCPQRRAFLNRLDRGFRCWLSGLFGKPDTRPDK